MQIAARLGEISDGKTSTMKIPVGLTVSILQKARE